MNSTITSQIRVRAILLCLLSWVLLVWAGSTPVSSQTSIAQENAYALAGVGSDSSSSMAARPAKTYRNPIIDRLGLADPHAIRHQGKYLLYPTSDTRGYDVFVSEDLVHWEQKARVFSDARGGVWAPDVFFNQQGDGRFYLYYTVDAPNLPPSVLNLRKQVGVAVAEGPLGPFIDQGVLADHAIDAHLFQDDDGALYLYYVDLAGGFKIAVQQMADPLTKQGRYRDVLHPTEEWEKVSGAITEAPWILKRNRIYYLMYSGTGASSPDHAIGYATARSPLGPFVKHPGNPIARRGGGVLGPGHHSVVEGPDGRLWMVYHQKASIRIGWDRFLAIDPLWFGEQGVIRVRTTRGTDEPAP